MPYTVELYPSQRRFVVDGMETILEAGLRHGIALPYRCTSGSCGQCKAWLLRGELGEPVPHDAPVVKAAERARRPFLLCANRPGSDLVIQAAEARGVEDIALQEIPAQVLDIADVHPDVRIVRVRTPRQQTLRFLPGQHVTLAINGVGPRNKSIASCPCNASQLEFHFHRAPNDGFADHVFARLRRGDPLTISGPHGRFHLDRSAPEPILFLAYETGFAVIKSLIEHAISLELSQALHLYWIARVAGSHYLLPPCRAWAATLDNFRFTALVNGAAGDPLDALAVQVTADYPDLAGHRVYMNGPPAGSVALGAALSRHGLPAGRFAVDSMQRY